MSVDRVGLYACLSAGAAKSGPLHTILHKRRWGQVVAEALASGRAAGKFRIPKSSRWRSSGGSAQEMGKQTVGVLYVVAMAAVIVGVDFMLFRNRFWARLMANIGIVLLFAAFYLRFLRQP